MVRYRLHTPTLKSATSEHSIIGNSSACSAMFRHSHSRVNSEIVGTLSRRIRLLRIGFGNYTATFHMPLREYIPNESDGKALPISSFNNPEKVPETSKI